MGPLTGVKVLELAAIGPVPFCGMLLGDMGAEVLRIDRMTDTDLGIEVPTAYELRGRNKRSVAIDLKKPEGRDALMRLVKQADVLLEGFRPGVAERLSIGPKDCFVHRPQLVYGRATGWGQHGPMAQEVGHDINYLALTGALDMIGPIGGAPVPPLNIVGDYGGGALYLAFGVMCALFESRVSGKGQIVDAAMIDGVTSLLTVFHGYRQAGLLRPGRGNNMLDGGAPYYTTYPTKDGHYVAVGAIEPRFYAALIEGLGLDTAALPAQNDHARWPELRAKLAERFLERTREEWEKQFEGTDACFSPVLSIDEAAAHPHNVAREQFVAVDGILHPSPAPRLSRTPGAIKSNSPQNAQHTLEALVDWGFSPDDVTEGLRRGIFMKQRDNKVPPITTS
jgi:alpha-methylacyl-CoA racemase